MTKIFPLVTWSITNSKISVIGKVMSQLFPTEIKNGRNWSIQITQQGCSSEEYKTPKNGKPISSDCMISC